MDEHDPEWLPDAAPAEPDVASRRSRRTPRSSSAEMDLLRDQLEAAFAEVVGQVDHLGRRVAEHARRPPTRSPRSWSSSPSAANGTLALRQRARRHPRRGRRRERGAMGARVLVGRPGARSSSGWVTWMRPFRRPIASSCASRTNRSPWTRAAWRRSRAGGRSTTPPTSPTSGVTWSCSRSPLGHRTRRSARCGPPSSGSRTACSR